MSGRFNNLTVQLLGDDDTPLDPSLLSRSVFLQSATSFNYSRIVGEATERFAKDPSLGHLWSDVPSKDGAFEFELATVLPYYLPTFTRKPEFTVSIGGSDLIVCSRMLRCFYSRADTAVDALEYFLVHRCGLPRLIESQGLIHVHPVPLRTFVTKRFSCQSDNAEEAIQAHFLDWMDKFLSEIASLVDSVRVAGPPEVRHLFPHLARPSFPLFWLLVQGNNAHGSAQFCGDLPQHAFRPVHDLDQSAVDRLHAYLSGARYVAVHRAALSLARTYVHYGSLELAILHVCIASEAALGQVYKTYLLSRGVSKTKYDEAEPDIGFSALLNLHLYSACDINKLLDHEDVVGSINWARRTRNDIMHRGAARVALKRPDVDRTIEAAESLIAFLRDEAALET